LWLILQKTSEAKQKQISKQVDQFKMISNMRTSCVGKFTFKIKKIDKKLSNQKPI